MSVNLPITASQMDGFLLCLLCRKAMSIHEVELFETALLVGRNRGASEALLSRFDRHRLESLRGLSTSKQ